MKFLIFPHSNFDVCPETYFCNLTQCAQKTLLLWKSWTAGGGGFCNCSVRILGNVSVVKSVSLPVAGSFTETACIWNVSIYSPDHPKYLTAWLKRYYMTEPVLYYRVCNVLKCVSLFPILFLIIFSALVLFYFSARYGVLWRWLSNRSGEM